jgi:hypothetical protein
VKHIGERLQQVEKTIIFDGADEINRGGYVLLSQHVLTTPKLSPGAKCVHALLIHYGWNNEYCFPGQDRIAKDMGMSASRINEFTKELEANGFIEIIRRGQGKTNVYRIKFRFKKRARPKS